MVFLGSMYFEAELPERLAAARRQAAAFGWDDPVAVRDDPGDVVAFIDEHDPAAAGTAGVEWRREHQDP